MKGKNEYGYFTATEKCNWMAAMEGRDTQIPRDVHYLAEFCEEKRGRALRQTGDKWSKLYRFSDPLMRPFLIINAFKDRKLAPHVLGLFVKEPVKKLQEEFPF